MGLAQFEATSSSSEEPHSAAAARADDPQPEFDAVPPTIFYPMENTQGGLVESDDMGDMGVLMETRPGIFLICPRVSDTFGGSAVVGAPVGATPSLWAPQWARVAHNSSYVLPGIPAQLQ
eukprot:4676038-Pyramimonas_sp.AAC.1